MQPCNTGQVGSAKQLAMFAELGAPCQECLQANIALFPADIAGLDELCMGGLARIEEKEGEGNGHGHGHGDDGVAAGCTAHKTVQACTSAQCEWYKDPNEARGECYTPDDSAEAGATGEEAGACTVHKTAQACASARCEWYAAYMFIAFE